MMFINLKCTKSATHKILRLSVVVVFFVFFTEKQCLRNKNNTKNKIRKKSFPVDYQNKETVKLTGTMYYTVVLP